jgi:hypothetical protein
MNEKTCSVLFWIRNLFFPILQNVSLCSYKISKLEYQNSLFRGYYLNSGTTEFQNRSRSLPDCCRSCSILAASRGVGLWLTKTTSVWLGPSGHKLGIPLYLAIIWTLFISSASAVATKSLEDGKECLFITVITPPYAKGSNSFRKLSELVNGKTFQWALRRESSICLAKSEASGSSICATTTLVPANLAIRAVNLTSNPSFVKFLGYALRMSSKSNLRCASVLASVSAICFSNDLACSMAWAASLSVFDASGISHTRPAITKIQQIAPMTSTAHSCLLNHRLNRSFENISNPSPATPIITRMIPGCLLANSDMSDQSVMGEKVDRAAPYVLKGALIILGVLQCFRLLIKKKN